MGLSSAAQCSQVGRHRNYEGSPRISTKEVLGTRKEVLGTTKEVLGTKELGFLEFLLSQAS